MLTDSHWFRIVRPVLEPLGGVAFTLLWVMAEIGRTPLNIGAMVLLGLAIALSRLVPIASLAVLLGTVALQIVGILQRPGSTDWPVYLAIPIVVGLIAARGPARMAWVGLGGGILAVVAGAAMMAFQPGGWNSWTTGTLTGWGYSIDPMVRAFAALGVLGIAIVALAWGSGRAIDYSVRLRSSRQDRSELERTIELSEVELAVAEERNRIAQEMHDVLAHSLAVVVAQADGARYLRTKRPAAVDDALRAISSAARGALVDVHGIIDGMLDGSQPPQPGLAQLDELIAGVGATGLQIGKTEAGEPGVLAPGQQLAVYRIVQEGITNALRHRGRGSSLAIVLDWRGPGLSLQLVSSGDGEVHPPLEKSRSQRGIAGMRERARLAGGWLAAGADDTGDYRVTAFVPYRAARTDASSESTAISEVVAA